MFRLHPLACLARTRLARTRLACTRLTAARRHARSDAGYTTETIVVTALLAILGMTVVGIIVAKVTAKANGIDLGG